MGFIDEKKKVITINKKRHRNKKAQKEFAKQDRSMINTIVHEEIHRVHPNMTEKGTRKMARKKVSSMSVKEKNKNYSRYK